jgi:hypothetical protein
MRRLVFVCAASAAVSLAAMGANPSASAAQPWWSPTALTDVSVTAVQMSGAALVVRTGSGTTFRSRDGGRSFTASSPPGSPAPSVRSGHDLWRIDPAGRVLHASDGHPPTRDPGSPLLGAGARLIAAPAALSGVVVAVATDGTVWRRSGTGSWGRSLLLLPRGITGGVPRVTAVAAFDVPVTATVYVATAGYAVLLSADGGDDWVRAGPGLPDDVFALAADPAARALYAGTERGLFVHHLQPFPSPASYRDAALFARWAGVGAVVLTAALVAGLLLLRLAPSRRGLS